MAANSKKVFVVDASFVLAFLLPDEKKKSTDEVFRGYIEGEISLISVPLLTYEVLNSLRSAFLQKRLNLKLCVQLASDFLNLIITEIPIDQKEVFQEALKKNLSFYDASYLVLAKAKHIPLLTKDKALKKLI